jgi:GNAT superfamily N-acetyltransferase
VTTQPTPVGAPAIRRALAADAARLTELALRSKAFWGYDDAFIEACRAELTLTPEEIGVHPTYLAEGAGELLGHYQLRLAGEVAEVWHLFVAAHAIGTGLGRRLWRHLEQTARIAGATTLAVDCDPNALGFYQAVGMVRVGQAPSGSIPGRTLPRLAKSL